MGNLLDYLAYAKDVPFEEQPLNEVDNLILAEVSYFDLAGIVPATDARVTVAAAHDALAARLAHEPQQPEGPLSGPPLDLLALMADGQRFAATTLSHFCQHADEKTHEQFAAVCVHLEDGHTYVSYRGTDSSLVGWREDFELSFTVVQAQLSAAAYLEVLARDVAGPLHVGGHSKGGNLAVYAAATCAAETQERIETVWCNDGPGLCRDVFPLERLDAIEDKVRRFVPHFCIIGALLDHREAAVVSSSGKGLLQHSALTWQVDGWSFAREDGVAEESRRFSAVFENIVEHFSLEEREAVVDALYAVLTSAGIRRLDDLAAITPLQVATAFKTLGSFDVKVQEAVEGFLTPILGESLSQAAQPVNAAVASALGMDHPQADSETEPPSGEKDHVRSRPLLGIRWNLSVARAVNWLRQASFSRGAALVALGMLCVSNAATATPVVLYVATFALAAYGIGTLVGFFSARREGTASVDDFIRGAASLVSGIALAALHTPLTASSNIVFGAVLMTCGIALLRRWVGAGRPRARRDVARCCVAVFSLVVGFALAVHPIDYAPVTMTLAGLLAAGKGIWDLVFLPKRKKS